jgi:hypothetical protein
MIIRNAENGWVIHNCKGFIAQATGLCSDLKRSNSCKSEQNMGNGGQKGGEIFCKIQYSIL